MTGQGEGRCTVPQGGMLLAEVRAVNNRHLKLNLRLGDGLGVLEPEIDGLVRAYVKRGTLNLNVVWSGRPMLDLYRIQPDVVEGYLRQCQAIAAKVGLSSAVTLSDVLALPGAVVESAASNADCPELREALTFAVTQALEQLNRMRSHEGAQMAAEIQRLVAQMIEHTSVIEQRAPAVLSDYRERLRTRVATAVAEAISAGEVAPLSETDLIREVALMSDRIDIREELVRLASHYDQLQQMVSSQDSQGRKLDFLVQEIFRECNTIGSKSSDALIAQRVVELKSTLEQVRELIQNVE